tara:strand:- start:960 stop:1118 length:159 start_codon:yes stop_codon:yes gene_type:complete
MGTDREEIVDIMHKVADPAELFKSEDLINKDALESLDMQQLQAIADILDKIK